MANVSKQKSETKIKNEKKNILDEINADDAFAILRTLAGEDAEIAKRIEKIAINYLSKVDIEEVADAVYTDLDCIDIEDVWEQSGSTRYGYVEPTEKAWEMFEEELEPHIKELKKYQELSMHIEAMKYCMGILKGIYMFEKESESEYKDLAVDAPGEYFRNVIDEWIKSNKNPENVKEMNMFIEKNCPGW